jgi:hypothetical protein
MSSNAKLTAASERHHPESAASREFSRLHANVANTECKNDASTTTRNWPAQEAAVSREFELSQSQRQ